MAENKTQPGAASVDAFLQAVEDPQMQQDCQTLLAMMREETGEAAVLWGENIVGFGRYRYRYASGREGEWFLAGFSPRKEALTVYIISGFDHFPELMQRLGKYKTGKSCLYLKRLSDVDGAALRELVRRSAQHMRDTNLPGRQLA